MKFRTEIESKPLKIEIDHNNKILTVGSCFASNIAERLVGSKFDCTANPTGILFNPKSIAEALGRYSRAGELSADDLICSGDLWFSYDFHGSFSDTTQSVALERMNRGLRLGAEALKGADRVVITFGTAWIYERDGCVVANCHKQPASTFQRRRLSVGEIVSDFSTLLTTSLADKEVIFTVSPIRHLGDGLVDNSLSKSILRVAIAELVESHSNAHYFPSYEILMDDLRDYRFYAEDMTHPTPQAIEYIWGRFKCMLLSTNAQVIIPRIEKIVVAANHRPLNAASDGYKNFCRKQLKEIESLSQVDFAAQKDFFERVLGS